MALKHIIREGDKTTHGGVVIESFATLNVYGKKASGIGHKVTYPLCKGVFVIVAGAETFTFMGKNVALEGMLTSCGAALISSLKDVKVEVQVSPSAVVEGEKAAIAATAATVAAKALAPYDEQTKLVSGLIEGVPYFIETKDGQIISGRIGADGKLPRIDTKDESEYSILWGDEALEKMGDK